MRYAYVRATYIGNVGNAGAPGQVSTGDSSPTQYLLNKLLALYINGYLVARTRVVLIYSAIVKTEKTGLELLFVSVRYLILVVFLSRPPMLTYSDTTPGCTTCSHTGAAHFVFFL